MHRILFKGSLNANVSFASYGIAQIWYNTSRKQLSSTYLFILLPPVAPLRKEWRKESLELVLFMFLLTVEYLLILVGIQTLSLLWSALVEATSLYLPSDVGNKHSGRRLLIIPLYFLLLGDFLWSLFLWGLFAPEGGLFGWSPFKDPLRGMDLTLLTKRWQYGLAQYWPFFPLHAIMSYSTSIDTPMCPKLQRTHTEHTSYRLLHTNLLG